MTTGIRLHRNCSASPRLLVAVLGLLVMMSLLIGTFFWFMGAPWVLPFAGLESALVVGAFVIHARSVSDCDEIFLTDDTLHIRQERRGRVQEQKFQRCFVRVSLTEGRTPTVRISAAGQHIELGHWLRPAACHAMYRQLQQDLPASPAHVCVQGLQAALAGHGVRLQPV